MDPTLAASTNFSKKPFPKRWIILTALFLFIIIGSVISYAAYLIWDKYSPNNQHVEPTVNGLKKPIYFRGEILKESALGAKEGLKLPFDVFTKIIDPTLRYEELTQSVIITTQDKVVRLKTDQLTAMINEKPYTLAFTVEKVDNTLYIPVEPLRDYYQIDAREPETASAVILMKAGDTVQWGKVIAQVNQLNQPLLRAERWISSLIKRGKQTDRLTALRAEPSVKAPIYKDLPAGEKVMIWSEENNWYRVQLISGTVGYISKAEISLDHLESIAYQVKKQTPLPWKPLGGKINLTWQQVTTKNPDTTKIPPMPGLNVISPQWFHLTDGEGNLKNLAEASYVKWAHSQNYQVWALFSNGFEQKRTTESLATYDKRMKMIKQLVSFSQMYNLQGINIDFENVALKDKANMIQFVREMTPFLHEQGLVVSIDVTVKGGSEYYSLFMDRRAIGSVVDYMMVMTYDEHWASSPIAGSVASLPWVEKGIAKIIAEDAIPASKLLIGVPFYTRIWTEQTKDGKLSVSSKAVAMEVVQKIITDKKLTPTYDVSAGQNYVEYIEDGKTMKIWIEDAMSMKSRMDIMKKLDLAGVASWSRSFETPDIWTVIQESMVKKP